MNRLEQLRKKVYMSQNDVAVLLNMSQTNYRKIEKGVIRLNVDVAIKLTSIFRVEKIEDLLDGAENKAS